jgi:transposase
VAKSEQEIQAALTGNFKDEQLFILRENLTHHHFLREHIRETDRQLAANMEHMPKRQDAADLPATAKRDCRCPDTPLTRERLYELLGTDLTQLDGVSVLTATAFLVNAGRDMSPWPTENHFVSWLGLSPNIRQSGGTTRSAPTRKTASALAHALRLSAMTIGRLDNSYLGAYCRRLKARLGAPKALTATARKVAIILYRAVKEGAPVRRLTAADYERTNQARLVTALRRRAAHFGFALTPKDPVPGPA